MEGRILTAVWSSEAKLTHGRYEDPENVGLSSALVFQTVFQYIFVTWKLRLLSLQRTLRF